MPVYGYARGSTDGQTIDAQIAQLRAAGAEKVFQETVSGALIRPVRSLRGYCARLSRVTASSSPALIGWRAQRGHR